MEKDGVDIAWIDTIDACQLKCPTCIRGVRGIKNTARKMELDTFAAIVGRLKDEGFRRIGLYNWTEPFLNRTIQDYIGKGKEAGFWVNLSTTLSLRHIDNLEQALVAGLDHLTVTISGFDQETYEINHVGGVWEYVLKNLHEVRDIIARYQLPTLVELRMLKFSYNLHQEESIRQFAEQMGFHFLPIDGIGDPKSDLLKAYTSAHFIREAEKAADVISPEDEGKACELMFNQIAIDSSGDVYVCCAVPTYPSLKLGKFLEMTADQILAKKFTHPFCRACTLPRRERTAAEDARLRTALDNTRLLHPEVALSSPPAKVSQELPSLQTP
jgi:MoaA/NifB/PqqE/SkfB family radical SAM enzyme